VNPTNAKAIATEARRHAMKRAASLSRCGTYRYELWRRWDGELEPAAASRFVMFVGLNPSTADAYADDATIRKCVSLAESWGYRAFCMANLFAFRATDPRGMIRAEDPVGPLADFTLRHIARRASLIVACWGTKGTHLGRDRAVCDILAPFGLQAIRLTKDGHPEHPLYLPLALRPSPWVPSIRGKA
jgi:hypothetical protein